MVLVLFLFTKKKIALNSDKIENKKEYLELLDRYNKNKLVKYKNEFNNKYVDDGYDAY